MSASTNHSPPGSTEMRCIPAQPPLEILRREAARQQANAAADHYQVREEVMQRYRRTLPVIRNGDEIGGTTLLNFAGGCRQAQNGCRSRRHHLEDSFHRYLLNVPAARDLIDHIAVGR